METNPRDELRLAIERHAKVHADRDKLLDSVQLAKAQIEENEAELASLAGIAEREADVVAEAMKANTQFVMPADIEDAIARRGEAERRKARMLAGLDKLNAELTEAERSLNVRGAVLLTLSDPIVEAEADVLAAEVVAAEGALYDARLKLYALSRASLGPSLPKFSGFAAATLRKFSPSADFRPPVAGTPAAAKFERLKGAFLRWRRALHSDHEAEPHCED
jgi:hypothetical protein